MVSTDVSWREKTSGWRDCGKLPIKKFQGRLVRWRPNIDEFGSKMSLMFLWPFSAGIQTLWRFKRGKFDTSKQFFGSRNGIFIVGLFLTLLLLLDSCGDNYWTNQLKFTYFISSPDFASCETWHLPPSCDFGSLSRYPSHVFLRHGFHPTTWRFVGIAAIQIQWPLSFKIIISPNSWEMIFQCPVCSKKTNRNNSQKKGKNHPKKKSGEVFCRPKK